MVYTDTSIRHVSTGPLHTPPHGSGGHYINPSCINRTPSHPATQKWGALHQSVMYQQDPSTPLHAEVGSTTSIHHVSTGPIHTPPHGSGEHYINPSCINRTHSHPSTQKWGALHQSIMYQQDPSTSLHTEVGSTTSIHHVSTGPLHIPPHGSGEHYINPSCINRTPPRGSGEHYINPSCINRTPPHPSTRKWVALHQSFMYQQDPSTPLHAEVGSTTSIHHVSTGPLHIPPHGSGEHYINPSCINRTPPHPSTRKWGALHQAIMYQQDPSTCLHTEVGSTTSSHHVSTGPLHTEVGSTTSSHHVSTGPIHTPPQGSGEDYINPSCINRTSPHGSGEHYRNVLILFLCT